jgi:outer membrane receptor protein involved in Fe transport
LVPGTNAQAIRTKSVSSNTSITGPALSYKPTDDILIRASIASGYVPPTNQELLPLNPTLEPSQNNTIIDPKTGTQTTGVTVYDLGGNPALRPTSSKSWNLGAVWAPQQGLLKGLRLDAEYTKIDQHNLILYASAQQIVTFEDNFPGLVTRDSTGTITSVTTEYVNVAEAKQSAWTYSLDYTFKTPIGSFELTGAETIQEHNQQQIVAGTKFLEFVGYPNTGGLAKVKATGTLRWAWRNWVASWTTTYFGGYNQWGAPGDPGAYASALETGTPYTLDTTYTLPQGGNTIPAQMYHNLYLSYAFPKNRLDSNSRFGRWANAFLNDAQISLNVNNVFNSLPPFDVWSSPFYASAYGDVQLRNYSVSIKKSW